MHIRILALASIISLALTGMAGAQGYTMEQPQQPAAQPLQPAQPTQPVQPGQQQEAKEYFPASSQGGAAGPSASGVPSSSQGGIPIMNQWLRQQEEQERLRQTLYGLDPYMYDRPASRSYR